MSGPTKLTEVEYQDLLSPLAKELSAMARWVSETNQRMIVVFEGRDTAGKGGSIDMFARLTPASDLQFRHGTNAPTSRIDGMTIAGA